MQTVAMQLLYWLGKGFLSIPVTFWKAQVEAFGHDCQKYAKLSNFSIPAGKALLQYMKYRKVVNQLFPSQNQRPALVYEVASEPIRAEL